MLIYHFANTLSQETELSQIYKDHEYCKAISILNSVL